MDFNCPHCGKTIEVSKKEDVTKAKSVGRPKSDLAGGVVASIAESVEAVVSKVDQRVDALTSLETLNQVANGQFSKSSGTSLGDGWGGALHGALRKRADLIQKGVEVGSAISPEEFAKADPNSLNKQAVAGMLQKMIHGALSKGDQK